MKTWSISLLLLCAYLLPSPVLAASTPICMRLLQIQAQMVLALRAANLVRSEDINEIETALFRSLRSANIRIEDIAHVGFDGGVFTITLADGTRQRLLTSSDPDVLPRAELKDLEALTKLLVPDDEPGRKYFEGQLRKLLESRVPEDMEVGDIALQALALLLRNNYVYVDPSTKNQWHFTPDWIPRAQYNKTWGRHDRRGDKTLASHPPLLFNGVRVERFMSSAIQEVEALDYRWNREQRRFEKNPALEKLEFKSSIIF